MIALIDAALFADTINTGEKLLRFDGAVVSFARREAVIAAAAVLSVKLFTKVPQHRHAAAFSALGQLHHLAQLPARNLTFLRFGDFVDESGVLDGVAGTEEQEAFARQTIAATRKGLVECGGQIDTDYRTKVEQALKTVENLAADGEAATQPGDAAKLKAALTALDEVTQPLADLMMDKAMVALLRKRGLVK